MSPAHLPVSFLALGVAASLLGCDSEDPQFVVSGSLVSVPEDSVRTGAVDIEVHRDDVAADVRDTRTLATNNDGFYGWPAPIEDAGANIEYTVIGYAPGVTPVVRFSIPAEASEEGRFVLPEVALWPMAAAIETSATGARLTWSAAPEDIDVLGYSIEVVGTRGDTDAVLWRQDFPDAAQTQVTLPAHRLEDYEVRASVVATLATEGAHAELWSDEASLGALAVPAMPLTRGATCTVPDTEACPFADGDLEVVYLPDASIVIALPEAIELDTIVVRGLMTDLGTTVAVEVSNNSRNFQPFAQEVVDRQPFYFDTRTRAPRTVRQIRLRAVDSTPSKFGIAEVSGF